MAKGVIKAPFFEIGPKSYLYGDDVLNLALAADVASEKYGVISSSPVLWWISALLRRPPSIFMFSRPIWTPSPWAEALRIPWQNLWWLQAQRAPS